MNNQLDATVNLSHPTKENIQALHGPAAAGALLAARELADTLLMSANALRGSPAALIQLCKQVHPDAGATEAVNLVLAQLKGLPASVAAFSERWSAVVQEMLHETKYLRLAAIERDDAIGEELRQLSNKLAAEKAQANAKRKALLDAGVAADEVARLAPEPADSAHAEQTAALTAERAIYSDFSRTLDASLLPPAVHERAKQLEQQKDWKIGVPQQVGA
jgi:hypothetical protein